MANQDKGEFDLVCGDTTYTLTLKTAGWRALQQHFSTPDKLADLDAVIAQVRAGSVDHIVVFVWACLRKFHPEIALEAVPDLIDDAGGLEGVDRQVMGELSASMTADPKDRAELESVQKRPRKARGMRGTGGNGSSSLVASA
jgi:hypothetical protein